VKIEGLLFALGSAFYLAVAAIYWYLSGDAIGTTALSLTGALTFLVAFYVLYTSKRVYPRPEDRLNGDIEEADPEYGFFSPHSWWPLAIGLSAAIISVGLIFAVWIIVFGVFLLFMSLFGWMFEYYRGEFAH
jgi:hypothetical protein